MDQPQRTVLVLSPWTSGFYYGTLLAGIAEELATEGYRVVLAQTLEAGTPNGLEEHIPEYSGTYGWDIADGAIALSVAVTAEYVRRLRASGIPVSLASVTVPGSNAPAAMPDNAGGITAALAHMVGHGHSKIAFLGNLVQYDTRERYEAWDTAMRDAGLTPRPDYFFNARDNEELGGEQGARAFLNLEDRPTAIVAGCDRNAIGFIRVVKQAGLRVPEDVAIIGYDNIAQGVMSSPPLSTVNQPFDEIGALAARLLLAQFHGENPSGIVHPRRALVVPRATCGCTSDQQSEPGPDPTLLDGTSYRTLVRRALLRRQACGTEEISQALRSVEPILDQPEAMAALAETLHAHLDDAAAHALDDTAVAAIEKMRSRTRVALWRQQTRHLVHQMGSTESAIAEQHRVTTALLSGPAPERLSWLEGTRAKAGVLALRKGGELVVTGAVDPRGTLDHLVGTVVTEAAFPPPELVDCANVDGSELTYVLPLVVHGKDWGVLAVVGPIDRVTDVQTWNQWGAQLCASLEQRHLAEALRANAQRYGAFAQALNEGMWEWNPSTGTATVSEKCRELLRVPFSAPDDEWHTMIMPEDRQAITVAVRAAISAPGEVVECEFRTVASDQVRWLRGRAVAIRSAGGALVVGSTADVTTRHLLEEELRRNALVDSVTGLPNRRDFIARLTSRITQAATDPSPYAVVFLDIDRFKVVNDSLGHQVGDELLAVIAGRLLSALRANDIAARLGGDEYGVILDGLNLDMMPVVLERIRARLEEPVEIGGHLLWVTASLGVATSEGRYTDPSQVLQDADTAMYHAKSTNPGTVAYFDSTMRESVVAHQRLEASLRKALDNREFEVHYQPVVSLAGGAVRRFESLVRWRRPGVGLVPPSEFLPLMEETGLIVRLGQFVLDESCRQLAEWIPAHPDVQTSVNLSDKEFWHTDMVASVRSALARHGLTGASLTLELTESILDRKPVVARQILEDLRAMGIRLHVDDFGAGHSSLQTLHAFPVEALKIDRSFVSDLDQARPRELVRAIVAMGAILGVDVIAEGIETASQASTLRAMGCRSGQGYLYGAALPAHVATTLLNGPDSDAAVIEPTSPLPLVPVPRPAAERLSSRFVSLRHR